MPHPYSTEARLKRYLAGKGERLAELLDRNGDGIADTDGTLSVLADAFERIDNDIDSELGTIYSVPFGTVTPTSPATATTYGQVADLSDLGTHWQLWFWKDPTAPETVDSRKLYDETLDALREKTKIIPGAALASVTTRQRRMKYESGGTEFAGGVTNGVRDAPYVDGQTVDPTRIL